MKKVYKEIIGNTRFKAHEELLERRMGLERHIRDIFSCDNNLEGLKLVGSAATGTMRSDSKDLDYVVVFSHIPNNDNFKRKVLESGLNIRKITEENKYGYIKVVGDYLSWEFVLVPTKNPRGEIKTYVDDAFYHPEFIEKNRGKNYIENVLLAKEFFIRAGAYKQVQGIGCEIMMLKFYDFDVLLQELATKNSIRVNFSPHDENYTDNPIVVDYPFLGKRSLVKTILPQDYNRIQRCAKEILENPENFLNNNFLL